MLRAARRFLAPPLKLEFNEVKSALDRMPGWATQPPPERAAIKKTYVFTDFHAAWGFMTACVPYINKADHHPEWFNVYNRVEVTLATHDCAGVSEKDLALARHMDSTALEFMKERSV
jgi:4a-hydroxytetrahydrobiopterin dehydratase